MMSSKFEGATTFSKTTLSINDIYHDAFSVIMLIVANWLIMLRDIVPSDVMLSDIMLNVFMLSAIMLNVSMLSAIMLNVLCWVSLC